MLKVKTFLLLLLACLPLYGTEHYLTVCAIFQNEAQWLKEWIEYHLVVGVDHFVLYNHQSSDNYQEVLQPYVDRGVVDLQDAVSPVELFGYAQRAHYNDCWMRYLWRTTWIAYIDIDEFIVPICSDSIKEILPQFEGKGGVTINWRCFGTSGIDKLDPSRLMIEQLTWTSARDGYKARNYKSIVQPGYLIHGRGVHYFHYKRPYRPVNTNGHYVNTSPPWEINTICDDKLVINHYFLRNRQWAYGEKLRRAARVYRRPIQKQRKEMEEADRLCTVEEDLRIQKFVPRVRKEMIDAITAP